MKLHDLRPNPGKKKKRKRVGRGIAAGQGKTAGRGTKGQNARSGGGVSLYFEGGQLPLVRRLPYKRGFTNVNKVHYDPVNLRDLNRIDFEGMEVTPDVLAAIGLVRKASNPVVILGDGDIEDALTIKAHRFSASAKRKIEAAGGTAVVIPLGDEE